MSTQRVDWSDIRPGDAILGGDGAWWYVMAANRGTFHQDMIAMVRHDGSASAIGAPSGPVTRAVPAPGLQEAIRNLRNAGFITEVISA